MLAYNHAMKLYDNALILMHLYYFAGDRVPLSGAGLHLVYDTAYAGSGRDGRDRAEGCRGRVQGSARGPM